MELDFQNFLRTFVDQLDPRAQQDPDWRKHEEQKKQRMDYENALTQAQTTNILDQPASRKRDDEAMAEYRSRQEETSRSRFEAQDARFQDSEAARLSRDESANADRDAARVQQETQFNERESRMSAAEKQNREEFQAVQDRLANPPDKESSMSDYLAAGEVTDPMTGKKSFSPTIAADRIKGFETMRAAKKEERRVAEELKNPSLTENERQDLKGEKNSSSALQHGGLDLSTGNPDPRADKPPALIDKDVKPPQTSENAQEIGKLLNRVQKAIAAGDMESLARMNDPKAIMEIERRYGLEAADSLRSILQNAR